MLKRYFNHILFVFLLLFINANHSLGCDIDVEIQQGDQLFVCDGHTQQLTATPGYVSYVWTGPVAGNGVVATPTASGMVYVQAEDANGCISTDSIQVTFGNIPVPVISSSGGTMICGGTNGTTLSLNNPYQSYLWSDGSTGPTLFVTETGTYNVVVTENGCRDTASIIINFVTFELVVAGGGNVCSGSPAILQASGGDIYAWSTGEFSPSITVLPTQGDVYSVTIYKGACFQTLTTSINLITLPPHNLPDTVVLMPGTIEYAFGPSGFDSYTWQPSSLLTDTVGNRTGYIGNASGDVTLVATSNSLGCALTHRIHFKMIDVTIPQGFSPNNDGVNDYFEIPEIYNFNATLMVWNRWGDLVFESDKYRNEWDGTCKTKFCVGSDVLPEGTYFYLLTIEGNKFEGYLTIKL